jgi:hypothetical protein
MGFVIDGLIYYVHEFLNANIFDKVYMSTPNLPIRTEIESDGASGYTKREGIFDDKNGIFIKAIGGTATITQICTSIMSEGGSQDLGSLRYASTDGTHVDANVADTVYAVLGIRLKSSYIGASIKLITTSLIAETSDSFEWILYLNPTVAGTFAYSGESQSAIEVARGATANTITGGYKLSGGWCSSQYRSLSEELNNAILLGATIAGTVDTIVLAVRPLTASLDIQGSISWRETT